MITDGKVIKHNHTCDFNIFLGKDKILGMNMMSLVTYYPEFQPQLTERANNELFDTQQVQLGAYQDAAPVLDTSSGMSGVPIIYSPAPYEEFVMDRTIEREYALTSPIWSTINVAELEIGSYQFPGDLTSQPFIADKIKNFFYMRAGMRISFRVSTNKFTTGSLLVTFIPHGSTTTFDEAGDIFHKSGYEHILLSANQSGTVTYDLPYIHPNRYIDPLTCRPNELWDIRVYVNDPLVNIDGEPCEVSVQVFAQFTDVTLAMPRTTPQSSVNTESILKSVGAVTSSKDTHSPMMAAVKTASSYASYTSAFAGSVMSVARMAQLGLSKPLSLNFAQKVTNDNYSDLNIGRGVSTANTMGLTYENKVSTMPLFTKESDEMRLTTLMGTPQMHRKRTFTKADYDAGVSYVISATPGNYFALNTYVDQITQMFAYNSGSMKLKVYMFSNSMVKARGVFWLTDNASATGDVWEDCYHRVVDIEGDSTVEFTIPYLSARFSSIRSSDAPFFVKFKLLAWSQPFSDAVVPLYLNIYKAAASDFRVDVPRDVMYQVQSNPRFDFTRDFEPMHPSFKSYNHSGILFGEEYTSVKDAICRPLPLKILLRSATVPPADTLIYDETGNVSAGKYWHLCLWGLFYRYRRGSVEFRIIAKTGFSSAILMNGSDIIPSTSIVTHGINKISVPYYTSQLFDITARDSTSNPNALRLRTNIANVGRFIYQNAGDDFSFHYIQPLPPGAFTQIDNPMSEFNEWAGSTTI